MNSKPKKSFRACGNLLVALAVAGAALAMTPAFASATPARYVYEQCDSVLPDGGIGGASFDVNPAGVDVAINTCAEPGGALAISQTGSSFATPSFWSVPGGTPVGGKTESITITAAVCTQGQPEVTAFAFQPEWPDSCHDEVRTYKEESPLAFGFYIWLECKHNNCPGEPWISAHYFAITEADPVPPTVTNLAGSLIAGGVIRGHQTISATGHDQGGGVSNVSIQVNGLPAAQAKTSNCQVAQANNSSVVGTVAAAVSPCPSSSSAGWTLDTSAYPFHNGANSVQVCASDFATLGDPNTTCSPARTVEVDNSCTESPVTGGEELSAQFARSNSDTETVDYGKTAAVTGRLANNAGDPVAGATLCVKTQTIGIRSNATTVGTVKTGAGGRYSYQVPPGPNREIVIGYRHEAFQVAREVRYYSHVQPSLRAQPRRLPNHHRVHFRGHLPGPNAGDRVVVLQANVTGSRRWITFRKAITNSKGGFRAAYQFVSTARTTRYRFRAIVPRQAGYPWAEGDSQPVSVVVKH